MLQEKTTLLFALKKQSVSKKEQSYYKQFAQQFSAVIGIKPEDSNDEWICQDFADTVEYSFEEGKVAALNQAVGKVTTPFAMILESDELCLSEKLPQDPSSDICYRALIDVTDSPEPQRNYQVRLFPVEDFDDKLFDGFSVPDITRSFRKSEWKLSEQVIPIHKSGTLFEVEDAEAEIANKESPTMSWFWQAILDSENQKYRRAEEKFRKVLKNDEELFEFYYLATLNGLANALVEQHKLEEATQIATKSIEVNSRQRAPYLTLYKVNDLRGRAQNAYENLEDYLGSLRYASRANLDVSLPLSECHYLMADTTFKQGDYERAFEHYEWFYVLNNGRVSLQVLEKLFIYAIELKNYEKSVHYFNDIFGDYIPDNLNEEMSARLLESLSLFMDNGWYDFVSDIYEELVQHNPEDNELLNGWITTLIKNKEIDKAQELIDKRKAS